MHDYHPLGMLAALWRYPVKALAAEALDVAHVGHDGLDGDRGSALFVATAGHARSGRTYRGKEHHLLHTAKDTAVATTLAHERGVAVDVRDDGPHFDAGIVSIVLDTWIAELERLAGGPIDPQRFRPNLYVRADPTFTLSEGELVGREIHAGGIVLSVVDTIKRCVTIGYDVRTGEDRPEILRATAQHRANVLGVYCDVRRPGTLTCGAHLAYE